LVDCIPNTRCIVVKGQAQCVPLKGQTKPAPVADCSTFPCPTGTSCAVLPKDRSCIDECEVEAACIGPNGQESSPPQSVGAKSLTASLASVSPIGRCLDSEVYSTCGTACEPSCRNPNPQICTLQCVIGCQCRSGFFRDDQKVCVAKCPGSPGGSCGRNEERKSCGTACEPTCAEPNPAVGAPSPSGPSWQDHDPSSKQPMASVILPREHPRNVRGPMVHGGGGRGEARRLARPMLGPLQSLAAAPGELVSPQWGPTLPL
uniref:TIL domain-containing protein n=1 Tax=Heligmosomoides polygyrus TaxID=6339 RepID=A0A183GCV6_HELPZ